MHRSTMVMGAVLLLGCLATAHGWGGLFNRFSSEMLANLGYGKQAYRQYPYGQVEPEDVYADALDGRSLDEALETPAECYSSPCNNNGDCCNGLLCLETDHGGRCLPAFGGRKMGEICNRENQCDAGLVCEEVLGETPVCRPPIALRKPYNAPCSKSSECDITRGLCCMLQRRHRQELRNACGYFKNPAACIGPVATDKVRNYVQHTAGEKRIIHHLP